MAIFHLHMQKVSRKSGHSAVAAAAEYSSGRLYDEYHDTLRDFSHLPQPRCSGIILPDRTVAPWTLNRSALWNAAELAERRKDACVALLFTIALPHVLTDDGRFLLTCDFSRYIANRYGSAVDFSVRHPHKHNDARNHHARIIVTTRKITPTGLECRIDIQRSGTWLHEHAMPRSRDQLHEIRKSWSTLANDHLASAGHDCRIDERSLDDRGYGIKPSKHLGRKASQMQRRECDIWRERLLPRDASHNATVITENPESFLELIASANSTFGRSHITDALWRYIGDDDACDAALAAVLASPSLAQITPVDEMPALYRFQAKTEPDTSRA